jgi:hypothetical protein
MVVGNNSEQKNNSDGVRKSWINSGTQRICIQCDLQGFQLQGPNAYWSYVVFFAALDKILSEKIDSNGVRMVQTNAQLA